MEDGPESPDALLCPVANSTILDIRENGRKEKTWLSLAVSHLTILTAVHP